MTLTVYVAFLRGINVGGKSKVPMAQLKACFEDMGFSNVRTYINSGNVIFTAADTNSRALEAVIEPALEKAFSFPITVVVRSMSEMEATMQCVPKSWKGDANTRYYILFLRHTIDKPDIIQHMQPRAEVDDVSYGAGAVFWSTPMNLRTKSSMQKIMATPLYKDITIRNANTTRKVYELMSKPQQD
ncbi:MAG TPA: DUF1697 domain-containing protein [Candidatus Saccharimonadales bacterium]|nr:DUF1697 domain-containing protein [Candidatus Saccharimonadales bacterium]